MEKTPANALRIPFINVVYPDCFFIHVIRDGRHTTASLIARRVQPAFAPHQWVQAHRTALTDLEAIPAERVCLVRYEELVADPSSTLRQVCHKCQLRWDELTVTCLQETARQRLVPVEDRWARLSPIVRGYSLRVIAELQRSLGYPLDL